MKLTDQLRGLDDRALRGRGTPERQEWFARSGWLLLLAFAIIFGLAGLLLVAASIQQPGPGAAFLVALMFATAAAVARRRHRRGDTHQA